MGPPPDMKRTTIWIPGHFVFSAAKETALTYSKTQELGGVHGSGQST